MHHSFKMSYLEPILVHPVRRQIFGDTSGQTFYMTRDPVLQELLHSEMKIGFLNQVEWKRTKFVLEQSS